MESRTLKENLPKFSNQKLVALYDKYAGTEFENLIIKEIIKRFKNISI